MLKKVDSRKKYSEMEKEVMVFWKKNKIFEKSVQQREGNKTYSFYDGPPFITGVPHHGTLLSSIVKDCVPRYWTMKGFQVKRRWGWDCHGLPAENMVEQKLGIKSKREIEENVGIEEFNKICFAETSKIASEWENVIDRIGRWVEFKNAYKTMDKDYMESVWWAFKQMHEKGLVYEDVRISLYCPRCSTPLSNFEIAMDKSYEIDTDTAVFIKFQIVGDADDLLGIDSGSKVYFLAWTTTPWTLLANVALAVNSKITYSMVKMNDSEEVFVLAKNQLDTLGKDTYSEIQSFPGSDLVGYKYKPIFDFDEKYLKKGEKPHIVVDEEFVTTEEGTGIVHMAPAFGEDDFESRRKNKLPLVLNVDDEGRFYDGRWKGEKVWDANARIVEWLEKQGILYKKEEITHSYPHCHRCHTKLIYKAQPAWFVSIEKLRNKLLENNDHVNWFPRHFKEGRFKKGIESAPEWNISRDRYWGTAMPVWKCSNKDCNEIQVVGSYHELKELSGTELDNYHRPFVDKVTIPCEKCGNDMKRVPQVLDCWVESGSMPFAQFHYPFENKEVFKKSFPTDFISEYVGQVRAWFYVLHVVATGVFDKESFKNVIVTGNIAGEDGRKMSKSLGNYTDPNEILEKYSADALRFYLLSSPLLVGKDINFSEEAIGDIQRRFLGTLWNSYSFFALYASVDNWQPDNFDEHEVEYKENLLDRWIMSELNTLIIKVSNAMDSYNLVKATKPLAVFTDNLSNWYIRRSRRRFWKSENDQDKQQAYKTLWTVLETLSRVLAPFCPFLAEEIYKNITGKESVHLVDFPVGDEQMTDNKLSSKMNITRKAIEIGLSIRAEKGIKVRQPLALAEIGIKDIQLESQYLELIADELNVKEVKVVNGKNGKLLKKEEGEITVGIDIELTPDLQKEGNMREMVRYIQNARKKAGYDVEDRISLWYEGSEEIFEDFKEIISKEVLATEIKKGNPKSDNDVYNQKIQLDEQATDIWIKKSKEEQK